MSLQLHGWSFEHIYAPGSLKFTIYWLGRTYRKRISPDNDWHGKVIYFHSLEWSSTTRTQAHDDAIIVIENEFEVDWCDTIVFHLYMRLVGIGRHSMRQRGVYIFL